uniref:Uncharacterized protein n=1 Tax=Arundo donax TaxID=35708 RepID=A0A0A9C5H9_ARUDO
MSWCMLQMIIGPCPLSNLTPLILKSFPDAS